MIPVPLPGGVTLEIDPDARHVLTRWPDGKAVPGTREPTPENRAQVAEDGYDATAQGCWRSLVDHEAAHTIVAPDLWLDGWSAALRHEAGDPRPYRHRLYEEAVVLSFQAHMNGLRVDTALLPHLIHLDRWRGALLAVWKHAPPPAATPARQAA